MTASRGQQVERIKEKTGDLQYPTLIGADREREDKENNLRQLINKPFFNSIMSRRERFSLLFYDDMMWW
jgi:hypothetical protein